jgi:hypothetical protein
MVGDTLRGARSDGVSGFVHSLMRVRRAVAAPRGDRRESRPASEEEARIQFIISPNRRATITHEQDCEHLTGFGLGQNCWVRDILGDRLSALAASAALRPASARSPRRRRTLPPRRRGGADAIDRRRGG